MWLLFGLCDAFNVSHASAATINKERKVDHSTECVRVSSISPPGDHVTPQSAVTALPAETTFQRGRNCVITSMRISRKGGKSRSQYVVSVAGLLGNVVQSDVLMLVLPAAMDVRGCI
ncbi:hypothetical protein F2P81_014074 [Scophthalmus maximus]|uniref:Secreted protein n=1 Tax=Scophthalmus maximus TaxID=52904 RepID=A0A6A4SPE2_SCOMX|nr:hypothetical protein F2P81_014074 [Scophthalmus maximus]